MSIDLVVALRRCQLVSLVKSGLTSLKIVNACHIEFEKQVISAAEAGIDSNSHIIHHIQALVDPYSQQDAVSTGIHGKSKVYFANAMSSALAKAKPKPDGPQDEKDEEEPREAYSRHNQYHLNAAWLATMQLLLPHQLGEARAEDHEWDLARPSEALAEQL